LTAGERSASDRYSLRKLNTNFHDRPLPDCTVDAFTAALADLSPATFNRYRAIIVAILNHAGHAIKFPTRKVKKGRLRFLTQDEWERLSAALPAYLKPIAAFAIATGLRQKNVTHLRWNEIDLSRAVLWVHPDEAKAGKPIGIPLSAEALAILKGQAGKHKEWVFPYKGRGRKEGGPVVKIKTAWQNAMEKAGLGHFERWEEDGKKRKRWVGDFTFHGLRHTWASWHVMSGTPLEVLQKLGAWEDPRMVQNYAHLAPEYLAGFANNAKPWKPKQAA
jgi:integrase